MQLKFLIEFLKNPMCVGAIAPSSVNLAKEMLHYWPNKENATIVEYGPGTGVFTKKINERIKAHNVHAFELNPEFINNLKSQFPNINIVNDSAEKLPDVLEENNHEKASLIVSGLPWAIFNSELQESLLNSTTNN
jgi:phosphatidylethanolamine/phosphatidyl-N-methylethanolamine N-methyltransferase